MLFLVSYGQDGKGVGCSLIRLERVLSGLLPNGQGRASPDLRVTRRDRAAVCGPSCLGGQGGEGEEWMLFSDNQL